jgi:Nodulation protein Z (NodZ)
MNERYVLSTRFTGLGDRLICLAAAWLYARDTGRSLVVDWRFGGLTEDSANAFPLCFCPASKLSGVPFYANIAAASLPKPRFPELWNQDVLVKLPFLRPSRHIFADRDLAVDLIRERQDVPAPTVVFDTCVNDGLVNLEDARAFFDDVEPTPSIHERLSRFGKGIRAAIALHVRHGNGGNIMGHAPYWASFDRSIDSCLRAVTYARSSLGYMAPVFLSTDSAEVQASLQNKLENLVTWPKTFLPPGTGELHLCRHAWERREDAVTEMLLLGECAALIRYPPGSFFSFYAACILSRNDPSLITAYDLQQPWDRSDPLSPSVIFRR